MAFFTCCAIFVFSFGWRGGASSRPSVRVRVRIRVRVEVRVRIRFRLRVRLRLRLRLSVSETRLTPSLHEQRAEGDSAIRDRTGDSSTRMYVALATKPRRLNAKRVVVDRAP